MCRIEFLSECSYCCTPLGGVATALSGVTGHFRKDDRQWGAAPQLSCVEHGLLGLIQLGERQIDNYHPISRLGTSPG